uniref:Small ribosomal subunit protein uS4c n=1 Tax=Nephroselmis olivacea TaxID=31312 RepID=RR4_NEPOL|nr:ribosomal protein S4 [Nephroselmis olivacea]Q9TKX5.1 RecName: Full=Small ribosomal subunit protein uS4c; AltName: Full=30S ribosomal protein S4, chloroplastic [Nephroselmis olivacea]AAD54841.1 ribosomal protein S4 [Nephroselmis olivacea]
MSRYRGPRLKIVRRLGELPGLTRKMAKRKSPPGQHGAASKKPSQYRIRLEEKQKLRYNYGVTEKQLLRYMQRARRAKGSSGENLLQLLEMRLDTTIFRLGMAPTMLSARQLITHGHILVSEQRVNIPSYQCSPKEKISIRSNSRSRKLIEGYMSTMGSIVTPPHLELKKEKLEGNIQEIIDRQWVGLPINELLVVEYYSPKV